MIDPSEVIDRLVSATVARFGDDVNIIACYGSRARGDASPGSDLDIFYIPAEGADPPAARSFVVAGLPVDFWPIRWETAERIATGRFRNWAVAPGIVGQSKIVHARSEEDRRRYLALRERIAALQRPEARADMVRRALAAYPRMLLHLENLRRSEEAGDLAGVRVAAARLVAAVLDALALANQETFDGGWHRVLGDADRLDARPEGLRRRAREILTSPDGGTVRARAESLVEDTREVLRRVQETACPPPPADRVLRGAYAEIREHLDKLAGACSSGDRILAALEAVTVQDEISLLLGATRSGLGYGEFNRYAEYGDLFENTGFPDLLADVADLPRLATRAEELDAAVRSWLGERGVEIHRLAGLDELERWLAG